MSFTPNRALRELQNPPSLAYDPIRDIFGPRTPLRTPSPPKWSPITPQRTPSGPKRSPISPLTPSRQARGRAPRARELTEYQRIEIRTLHSVGYTYIEIKQELGYTYSQIQRAVTGPLESRKKGRCGRKDTANSPDLNPSRIYSGS